MNESAQFLAGRRLQWLVWMTALTGLAYLGISFWSGWRDVATAIGRVGLVGVGLALFLSLINYGLRFVRWQYYLRLLGHTVPLVASLRIYLAGFALTIVPGKAGETVRSVFLKLHDVGYRPSLAAFFSERLSDMLSILALASIGMWQYQQAQPMVLLLAAVLILVLLLLNRPRLLSWLHRRFKGRLSDRTAILLDAALGILQHSGHCMRPPALLLGFVLGTLAWGAEGLAFYLVLQWMGASLELQTALFIYAFSMLVGAISFLPGGLGGAEAVMVGLLLVNSINEPTAVAATILIRLATLWFAVFLGILAMLLQVRHKSKPAPFCRNPAR